MVAEPRLVQTRTTTFTRTGTQSGRIDLTTVVHADQTLLHTKGIYAMQQDQLTYCIGRPGDARPTGFATSKGDGRTLAVLRRVHPESQ
jgi:hypothetical protein